MLLIKQLTYFTKIGDSAQFYASSHRTQF